MGALTLVGAGRPRKPTELKRRNGTYDSRSGSANEPRSASVPLPPPPEYLTKSQKIAWKRLAKLVDPLRVATAADVMAFESLVCAYVMRRDAEDSLRSDGNTSPVYECATQFGVVLRPRPEIAIIAQFDRNFAGWCTRFGLTPADRSRVAQLDQDRSSDPLDEFGAGPRGGGPHGT
ncbi:MAG: phage terminase small subunit P27 family [Chloracidobacterium sp.]|nr:phage terminase small subunit P27 family [Chloracidobacterium sp.]